ncbi:MAG: protein phosphatase 2C domain-containing protein [Hyphomicrobiaceae bacterium]
MTTATPLNSTAATPLDEKQSEPAAALVPVTKFDCAVRATRGARDYQEDAALVWPGRDAPAPDGTSSPAEAVQMLAILADGMGGHAGGALASRTCCDYFLQSFSHHSGSIVEGLMDALARANAAITDKVEANPLLSGMGSTLVAVTFAPQGINWVSVGDSPLLLWRRGEIALLNEDHSLAPDLDRLAAAGKMTVSEAKRDPRRHMLRSAVTGDDIDLVDISRRPLVLEPGDYVVLASDGLQSLDNTEIERIIAAYGADGSEAVAAALIRTIDQLREPHQDNATVVVVRPV